MGKLEKRLMADKVGYDPAGPRQRFIVSESGIERNRIAEAKAWYSGDSAEILNFFTNDVWDGIPRDPIYWRNKQEYFWVTSAGEQGFKRVHSGIPRAIVETLSNIVGVPTLVSDDKADEALMASMADDTGLMETVFKRQIPLTLALGRGCFKVNVPGDGGKPEAEFYEADRCHMEWRGERLARADFYDWYVSGSRRYRLVESRWADGEGSHCSYALYETWDGDIGQGKLVPLSTLAETAGLRDGVIPGIKEIMAVPCIFFDDPLRPHGGRSVYMGKFDLFDFLDETLSEHDMTIRVSVPQEYYPEDLLRRGRDGVPERPSSFSRRYTIVAASMASDPSSDPNRIQTTQPDMKTDQYIQAANAIIERILVGIMSPGTLGVVSDQRDNYLDREKMRDTVFTRNTIIESECRILAKLCDLMLQALDYVDGKEIKRHFVKARFSDFALPTLENEIGVLGNAYSRGQISTDLYVRTLWKDRLTDEEMKEEIERLEEIRKRALFAPMAYERNNMAGGDNGLLGDGADSEGEGDAKEKDENWGGRRSGTGVPDGDPDVG